MILGLRVAAIVMAAIVSTSVMAQTTGTLPPQPPPYGVAPSPPPPGTGQFSSNEVIDAGHRFFGGVSHGLAMVVEKAVSQWGLPNGYILGQEASGAFVGGLRYGDGTLYT
ncbi:MAG: EipA family protein, partial [Xanthobacteraceae bacterium]